MEVITHNDVEGVFIPFDEFERIKYLQRKQRESIIDLERTLKSFF